MPTGDMNKSKVLLANSVTQPQQKLMEDKLTPPTVTMERSSDSQRRRCGALLPPQQEGRCSWRTSVSPSLGSGVGHTPQGSQVRGGTASQWPGGRGHNAQGPGLSLAHRSKRCADGRKHVPWWKTGDRGPLQAPAFRAEHRGRSLPQPQIHPKGADGTTGQWLWRRFMDHR